MSRTVTTIKVKAETHARLAEIAKEDDQTMGEVITHLVERCERERFWKGVAGDLKDFKSDTEAYHQYREEFAEWDHQTTETLEREEPYYQDGAE